MRGYCLGQAGRNSITDLARYLYLAPTPKEVVLESLQARGFEMSNRSVHSVTTTPIPLRVEVCTLLGFEELGADCVRREVPLHPAHDVSRACRLLFPASGQQMRGDMEAPTAGFHVVVPIEGQLRRVTADMEI